MKPPTIVRMRKVETSSPNDAAKSGNLYFLPAQTEKYHKAARKKTSTKCW